MVPTARAKKAARNRVVLLLGLGAGLGMTRKTARKVMRSINATVEKVRKARR